MCAVRLILAKIFGTFKKMSFAKVHTAQTNMLSASIIDVEVDISKGIYSFAIVGLPDKATEEARDRVSAAIKNSGFTSPKQKNQKTVIALAPADIKKEGASFDAAIAAAYLLAEGEVEFDPKGIMLLGELSLDGKARPVKGVLPMASAARDSGFHTIIVPKENAEEAALVEGIRVFGAENLQQILDHLTGSNPLQKHPQTIISAEEKSRRGSFDDIKGQENAKRALVIAASGKHNIALYGPPGTGKTMLARALASILPPLPTEHILEVTGIHSIAGTLSHPYAKEAPFRSPHHTSSYVALVGGGASLRPGEITLAHRGVLFLDEFPEFETRVIESLREPLEERRISISRARGSAVFPANFILVAAMNPCPCGNRSFPGPACSCMPAQIMRYERKLSGPIVDRIDMWIPVPRIDHGTLMEKGGTGEGELARKTTESVRKKQEDRYMQRKMGRKAAGELSAKELVSSIELDDATKQVLNEAARKLGLSARSYHKTVRLSRTIADLDNSEEIKPEHIMEALSYRPPKSSML